MQRKLENNLNSLQSGFGSKYFQNQKTRSSWPHAGISLCATFKVRSHPLCIYYVIFGFKEKQFAILSKKKTFLHIFYENRLIFGHR